MQWLERLNQALDYLEEHLRQPIDMNELARIACCSTFHFQRMFSYIAGVPLSEYIRRRRMTSAAFDLQNGDKVLDVALRYGYESPTSFNRAFQGVHGVSPSAVRREQGVSMKAYPRISFKITVKGEAEMDYRIIKKEAFRIVGPKIPLSANLEPNFQKVPLFWQEVTQQGTIPVLCEMMNGEPAGLLGVSTCLSGEDVDYYIAVATDRPVPQGMSEYQVPACTWAVFPGEGPMPNSIQELQKRIVTEWLPTSGYEYADAPDVEVYLSPDPREPRFEVWLPVIKKA